jgi:iron complex transport system ATP-binding protein
MTYLAAQNLDVALAGCRVLNGISLSLSSGHLVALVGPNGAGKTTLLRALAGLIPSDGHQVGGGPCRRCRCAREAKRFKAGVRCTGRRRRATSRRSPLPAAPPIRLARRRAAVRCCAMQVVDARVAERRVTGVVGERSRVALAACWRWRRRSSWRTSRPPRSIRATRSTS